MCYIIISAPFLLDGPGIWVFHKNYEYDLTSVVSFIIIAA